MSAKKRANKPDTKALKQPVQPPASVPKTAVSPGWIWEKMPLFLAVVVWLLVLGVRFRLLNMPFERDEGGFAYVARWMVAGERLYDGLYDNKLPGLYGLYALFINLFGYSPWGVHLGLLLCNAAAGYFLYRWAALRFDAWTAGFAAAFFGLLSAAPNVLGFAAHATQLLLPFSLAGLWLCEKAARSQSLRQWLLGGLLLGAGFMIKQSAVVFGLFVGIDLLLRAWFDKRPLVPTARQLGCVVLGAALPFVLTIGYFAATGRFNELWLWTVDLPAEAGAGNQKFLWYFVKTYFAFVVRHFEALWAVAALGLVGVWFMRTALVNKIAAALFFALSLGSVFIGLAFYPHYFVLALPAVALLAALLLAALRTRTGNAVPVVLAVALLVIPVARNYYYYFTDNFNTIQRICYGSNFFPELRKIGEELGRRVASGQRIAVLGSEPQVMVYANRASATGHLFMYPILQGHPKSAVFRQQYLDDLKKNQPEYIVYNTLPTSWKQGYTDEYFFKMAKNFVDQHYEEVGKAEMFSDGRPSVIYWDESAARYTFKTDRQILIYRLRHSTR